jgi:hypothetical protein
MLAATLEKLHKICLIADIGPFLPNLAVCKRLFYKASIYYSNQIQYQVTKISRPGTADLRIFRPVTTSQHFEST